MAIFILVSGIKVNDMEKENTFGRMVVSTKGITFSYFSFWKDDQPCGIGRLISSNGDM